jgi:formylmethanofuran dehydrogenase subunit B
VSRRGRSTAAEPAAHIDGAAADTEAALDRAAGLLTAARRVLVSGLTDATLDGVQAACDLAESLGAAIDAGAADVASPAGPIVARTGSVTADFDELRDRADLVVCWFCDPDACQPGFREAYLSPSLADGRPRTSIAVGPETVAGGRHLRLPTEAAVDAARLLQAVLLGHEPPPDNPSAARLVDACRDLAVAIHAADCVGVIASGDDAALGLDAWAVNLLVRSVAHQKPAFIAPLVAASAAALDNAAGAAAVLTWRYAAAGAIARADRRGGHFRPAECSTAALVARGEIDAVLAVGRLSPEIETAIAARAADLAVIRIDDRPAEPPGCAGPCVHLRSSQPAGTALRGDGREVTIGDRSGDCDDSMISLLKRLRERLVRGAAS